jgi:hypothetical protein
VVQPVVLVVLDLWAEAEAEAEEAHAVRVVSLQEVTVEILQKLYPMRLLLLIPWLLLQAVAVQAVQQVELLELLAQQ